MKSILGILEVQNLPINTFTGSNSQISPFTVVTSTIGEIWLIDPVEALNFYSFGRLKFTKITKFRPPEIETMAALELLDSPKLILRKI